MQKFKMRYCDYCDKKLESVSLFIFHLDGEISDDTPTFCNDECENNFDKDNFKNIDSYIDDNGKMYEGKELQKFKELKNSQNSQGHKEILELQKNIDRESIVARKRGEKAIVNNCQKGKNIAKKCVEKLKRDGYLDCDCANPFSKR